MTVLLAGVVLISLNGRFGITLLLQKQAAAAAHALLLSTQDFKTSILHRDGAASSQIKRGKRPDSVKPTGQLKGEEIPETNSTR